MFSGDVGCSLRFFFGFGLDPKEEKPIISAITASGSGEAGGEFGGVGDGMVRKNNGIEGEGVSTNFSKFANYLSYLNMESRRAKVRWLRNRKKLGYTL